jgi:hypothetical protein
MIHDVVLRFFNFILGYVVFPLRDDMYFANRLNEYWDREGVEFF